MQSKTSLVTPDGQTRTAGQWAHDLDIKYAPSMVFFDTQGKVVFRAEACLRTFHVRRHSDYQRACPLMSLLSGPSKNNNSSTLSSGNGLFSGISPG